MSIIFFFSLSLLKVNHPAHLAAILVLRAFFSSLLLGKIVIRWLFYLLGLVFLGGVIVVLLFMVSVCANEKFFYTSEVKKVLFIPVLFLLYFFIQPFVGITNSFNSFNLAILLYEKDVALIFISLMLVLMLCLISLVIVSKENQGL